MQDMHSVLLTTLVKEFHLEVAFASTDYEKIRLTVQDVARPGLQLAGYYDHFEPMRLQVMGNVETSYLQKLTAEEAEIVLRGVVSMAAGRGGRVGHGLVANRRGNLGLTDRKRMLAEHKPRYHRIEYRQHQRGDGGHQRQGLVLLLKAVNIP